MPLKISLRHFLLATVFLGTAIGLYISNMHGELTDLTATNFEKLVIDNDRPVLVAFTADWCSPCQKMKQELQDFTASISRRTTVGMVDIDNSPQLVKRYGVSAIPTLIVFRDGKPANQSIGLKDQSELREMLFEQ